MAQALGVHYTARACSGNTTPALLYVLSGCCCAVVSSLTAWLRSFKELILIGLRPRVLRGLLFSAASR